MPSEMTPRQRVQAAFAHTQGDRVPIDYSANAEIDLRLKEHFGLAADDGDGLGRYLGVDFRTCLPLYVGPRIHPEVPGVRVDPVWGQRTRWVEHEAGGYWDFCDWPLKDATDDEIDAWPMPSPDDFDYDSVAETCRRLEPHFICTGGAGIGDTINGTGFLFTMERVLVSMATDDPAYGRFVDRRHAVCLEWIGRTLAVADGRIDMLSLGEDLGTQIGPMIGLDLFRRQIRPRLQKFVDLARRWNIPVMIHSCGSSSWAFDDFVDMGITVVDTLQPEARDMAPAYLKQRFGRALSFHGMISTAGPLAYGSADDVVDTVKQTLAIMMPGGGYAVAPTHAIQSNSPTENVLAMYETARRWGRY